MSERAPLATIDAQTYLEAEKTARGRHEYVHGQLFAMVGSSRSHNLLAGNLLSLLRHHLHGGPCRVFMSDLKVRVEPADAFYYPDLVVTCDSADQDDYVITHPRLIIEVLSRSTEAIDRREKLLNYRRIASLAEYVLVSQERVEVEVYRREVEETWSYGIYRAGEQAMLQSVDMALDLALVYEDVVLRGGTGQSQP
jgi:Uma2 family endonuclease